MRIKVLTVKRDHQAVKLTHQGKPMLVRFSSRHTQFLPVMLLACAIVSTLKAKAESPFKVEVARVEQRSLIEEIPLNGTVSSPQISLLSTEVEGLISRVHVDAGDQVKAGDVLLELDTELSQIARDRARAAAEGARIAAEESKRRLADAQALVAQNNIAVAEVRGLEAQTRIDAATLRAAEAESRQRAAELSRHRLTAPFAATVSRKLAEVGEWLTPGSEVLELVATDGLRVDFQVPQRFFPRIDESTRIAMRFDAYPEQTIRGHVHRKVPLSDNGARTFLLRVVLDKEAPALIPGMSVNASLNLSVEGEGIAVSRDALLRYPDGRIGVWLVGQADGSNTAKVREQLVTTGLTFGDQVEIRSGLVAGQHVVVRGNESLREGQTVVIETSTRE
jgi:membrane fusion protein (multidrug efflux system)